jgi:hypothetical protein
MSVPRNHHFVSQVLIRKFLGTNEMLYTYSKKSKSIDEKPYERFDFAERDLNSTLNENGEIDHKSVEDNLNKYFESGFNKHYDLIIEGFKNDDYSNFETSVKFLIRMGVIGDMRTREHQQEIDQALFGALDTIMENATEELKSGYNNFIEKNSIVKNKSAIDYDELCNEIIDSMGEIIYSVFIVPKDNYFFLPDNSSVVFRSKLEPDTKLDDGTILINPSRPISTVVFPINSLILIVAQSSKISSQKESGVFQLSKDALIEYNKLFINKSRDKVISLNKDYLTNFINEHIKN